MKREILDTLLADRAAKRAVVVATVLSSGQQTLIYPFAPSEKMNGQGPSPALAGSPELIQAARTAAARDQCTTVHCAGEEVFLRVYNPPLRLIIVGAVHIAQALCPMATLAGFEVVVVDPRAAFASPARFPGVTLATKWPDQALADLDIDRRSAIVTLTHDPKIDEPALLVALNSEAFYIGALGSKKTQAARLRRLRERGIDEPTLERIHGPVGLSIGARSAAEIAVSVLAQIIVCLRGTAE